MKTPKQQERRKILFLDRDGTLIKEKHYLCDPDEVELCDNAVLGLRAFQSMGYCIVVVTNQSGIGRGLFKEDDMHAVHLKIENLLKDHGIYISQFLYCPHEPETGCPCRKPKTGMLDQLSGAIQPIWEQSLMIGDKACDIEFALHAELVAILVQTGYGKQYNFLLDARPSAVVSDLREAASWYQKHYTHA